MKHLAVKPGGGGASLSEVEGMTLRGWVPRRGLHLET